MKSFHIIHIFPKDNDGPSGYNEVIKSVMWGLNALGHKTSYARFEYSAIYSDIEKFENHINYNGINIVFGAQIIAMPLLEKLPKDTIIYNLEQRVGYFNSGNVPDEYKMQAESFRIWDYSLDNVNVWNSLNNKNSAQYVMIGYSPDLEHINSNISQDIDVLIYAGVTPNRLSAFAHLASLRLKSVYIVGLFGDSRDNLIARSKVILNIQNEGYDRIFEIVRVSYLFANKKAVISDFSIEGMIEQDVSQAVVLCPLDEVAAQCKLLINDEYRRKELERIGYQTIKARDMKIILQKALNDL